MLGNGFMKSEWGVFNTRAFTFLISRHASFQHSWTFTFATNPMSNL